MKKIFLLCSFALSLFAVDAQTKKNKSKKRGKQQTTENRMKARMDILETARQDQMEADIVARLTYDSIRKMNDSLSEARLIQEQEEWKGMKIREMDSTNLERFKMQAKERNSWAKIQAERAEINKKANLSDNQGRQVNYINQSIFDKARIIRQDSMMSDEERKQQLVKLNDERRSRIKAVLGKSKERKLEKARKSLSTQQTDDVEAQWINDVEGYVQNK